MSQTNIVTAAKLQAQVQALGNPQIAQANTRYFKTGPGQYGAGDVFAGLRAAQIHALVKEFRTLEFDQIQILLESPVHEDRLLGALILADQCAKTKKPSQRRQILDFYLANAKFINNWDIVDGSAPKVVGFGLSSLDTPERIKQLIPLAESANLWERRIAIVGCLSWIRSGQIEEALDIAGRLLDDSEDLIHKATGWMLREIGKRDQTVLETFLRTHIREMPRTALRYAIERFPEDLRQSFLRL